nr:tyrosine-type recombinase/integrase [Nitrosomonas nitrosa]
MHNLKTSDEALARSRVGPLKGKFRARVLEARGKAGSVQADALWWRQQITNSESVVDADATYDSAIAHASDAYVKGGWAAVKKAADRYEHGEPEALEAMGGPRAKTFIDIALRGVTPTHPYVAPWAASRELGVSPQTAAMDKSAVERFVTAFPTIGSITRAKVAQWVQDQRTNSDAAGRRVKGGLSAQTVRKELASLRSFWKYLVSREVVSEEARNPFLGHELREPVKVKEAKKRKPFAPEEGTALYQAALARDDQELADLIQMAAYTGMRREEMCRLRVENISGGEMEVIDAKSAAGNRHVPIHPKIKGTVARLIGKRTTGYLFANLKDAQYGKRGDKIGKRFGRLKTAAGFGRNHNLHVFRNSFITQLRAAGVPDNVLKDIVGHRPEGVTDTAYAARGATRPLRAAAIKHVKWPAPL